tara:strand:+ start:525 stop:794 length:270 start_codon:yes stop_codon:yes gene_type:complete
MLVCFFEWTVLGCGQECRTFYFLLVLMTIHAQHKKMGGTWFNKQIRFGLLYRDWKNVPAETKSHFFSLVLARHHSGVCLSYINQAQFLS